MSYSWHVSWHRTAWTLDGGHITHSMCLADMPCKGNALTRRPSSAGAASHAAHSFDTPEDTPEAAQAVQRRASESTLSTNLATHVLSMQSVCLQIQ